ncbi:unnamed protein product [Lota lota]
MVSIVQVSSRVSPRTEPCSLTRDFCENALGIAASHPCSRSLLDTPLSPPPPPPTRAPPPSRGQSHGGGSPNKLPGTTPLK